MINKETELDKQYTEWVSNNPSIPPELLLVAFSFKKHLEKNHEQNT